MSYPTQEEEREDLDTLALEPTTPSLSVAGTPSPYEPHEILLSHEETSMIDGGDDYLTTLDDILGDEEPRK